MKLREPIYIIGEGITEKYYFQHLKDLKSYSYKIKPRFFSSKNSIYYIEKKTEELLKADVTVICVFDTDTAQQDKKVEKSIKDFINKYKNNKRVIICDSLPSIEFWFLLHFKMTNKSFYNYKSISNVLKKFLPNYEKTEKYLMQDKWVEILITKQEQAVINAKNINSKTSSYSNIYRAIEIFEQRLSLQ